MLGVVPKLYDDELFYSWLCRYYIAKGFTSSSAFMMEVTGKTKLYLNKEFVPPFRNEFRQDIDDTFGFEHVIRNHTLYGQEARFYTEEEIKNVWKILQTDSFDIRDLFRMQKSKDGNFLRCCPICVKEEREEIGECYWHRSHQIQGIDICLKHKCKLKNSEIRVGSRHNEMISPAEWWCDDSETEIIKDSQCLKYFNYIKEIIDTPCNGIDTKKVMALLYKKLKEKGYRTLGQRLLGIMSEDMEQYYKNLGISIGTSYSTLQSLFAKNCFSFLPIMEVSYFLGIKVDELLNPDVTDIDVADEECSHYVSNHNNTNINRELLDRQYLPLFQKEVKLVYSGHYHKNGRPSKVSQNNVCNHVGVDKVHLKYMPKCKACIDMYKETNDEYHARIVVWAYNKLNEEKRKDSIHVSEIHRMTSVWKDDIIRSLPYMSKFADKETVKEIAGLVMNRKYNKLL